jgi:hypothetical protein
LDMPTEGERCPCVAGKRNWLVGRTSSIRRLVWVPGSAHILDERLLETAWQCHK